MRMKPISNKDKQIIKRIMKHKKQILLSFIILFMAVVLIDISPYGGQNLQLYAKWIECGHKPYKSTSSLNPTRTPYYTQLYSPVLLSSWDAGERFCTPHEAELAGYSASSDKYIYLNLNTEERKWLDEQINKGNL